MIKINNNIETIKKMTNECTLLNCVYHIDEGDKMSRVIKKYTTTDPASDLNIVIDCTKTYKPIKGTYSKECTGMHTDYYIDTPSYDLKTAMHKEYGIEPTAIFKNDESYMCHAEFEQIKEEYGLEEI